MESFESNLEAAQQKFEEAYKSIRRAIELAQEYKNGLPKSEQEEIEDSFLADRIMDKIKFMSDAALASKCECTAIFGILEQKPFGQIFK